MRLMQRGLRAITLRGQTLRARVCPASPSFERRGYGQDDEGTHMFLLPYYAPCAAGDIFTLDGAPFRALHVRRLTSHTAVLARRIPGRESL